MADKKTKIAFPDRMTIKGLVTPVGVLSFPRLQVPDSFQEGGQLKYSTKLRLPTESPKCAEMIAKIDAVVADLQAWLTDPAQKQYWPVDKKTGKKTEPIPQPSPCYGVYLEGPKDNRVPTDDTAFSFSCYATSKKGDVEVARKLKIASASGKDWPASIEVGGGSEARIYYSIRPYYVASTGFGVSLSLEAVQVKTARSFGGPKIDAMDGDDPEMDGAMEPGDSGEEAPNGEKPKGGAGSF